MPPGKLSPHIYFELLVQNFTYSLIELDTSQIIHIVYLFMLHDREESLLDAVKTD
jgi:hypothetical protein